MAGRKENLSRYAAHNGGMNITCANCNHASYDHSATGECNCLDHRTDTGLCPCMKYIDRVASVPQPDDIEQPSATARMEALCRVLVDDGHMTPVASRQVLLTSKLMIAKTEQDLVEEVAAAVHSKLGVTSRALPIIRAVRQKASAKDAD